MEIEIWKINDQLFPENFRRLRKIDVRINKYLYEDYLQLSNVNEKIRFIIPTEKKWDQKCINMISRHFFSENFLDQKFLHPKLFERFLKYILVTAKKRYPKHDPKFVVEEDYYHETLIKYILIPGKARIKNLTFFDISMFPPGIFC